MAAVPCLSMTEYSLSLLLAGVRLPELAAVGDSQSTFVTFQPQLDNGLVLVLTDGNATTALLAVGIFNGEVSLQ